MRVLNLRRLLLRKLISALFLILLFFAFYVFLSLNRDESRQEKERWLVSESVSDIEKMTEINSTYSDKLIKAFGAPAILPKSISFGKVSAFSFMGAKAGLLELEGDGFRINAIRPREAAAYFKRSSFKESYYSLFSMNIYISDENGNFQALMYDDNVMYLIGARAKSKEDFIKKLAFLTLKKE